MLSFKQSALQLRLHSGTTDAGTVGWRYGPVIAGLERRRLVAAFNGGFRLNVGAGGFESFGRTAAPLSDGLGSIVTYTDGTTDIGSWHHEVPAPGRRVASVRQNLPLLIDHGTAASTLDCLSCWGATLGGVIDPARSALGIQPNGHIVWAGAEHATVSALADALLRAGVVRAVELDINPEWVAGYLYGHRRRRRDARTGRGRPRPARHPWAVPGSLEPGLLHDRGELTRCYTCPCSTEIVTVKDPWTNERTRWWVAGERGMPNRPGAPYRRQVAMRPESVRYGSDRGRRGRMAGAAVHPKDDPHGQARRA